MAIINFSSNFVFVHIPKAAGTSVSKYFRPYNHYCDLEIGGTDFGEQVQVAYQQRFGLSKHSPAHVIRNIMGQVAWSKALTFAFVRNPYSRTLSTYNFLCKWPGCPHHLQQRLLEFGNFEDYVKSGIWKKTNGPDGIFLPQTHWTSRPSAPRHILVDRICKLEAIEAELAELTLVLGLGKEREAVVAPALNRSEQRYGLEGLGGGAIDMITDHYRLDFENFDYPEDDCPVEAPTRAGVVPPPPGAASGKADPPAAAGAATRVDAPPATPAATPTATSAAAPAATPVVTSRKADRAA